MTIHDSAEIGVKLTQEFLPDARKKERKIIIRKQVKGSRKIP